MRKLVRSRSKLLSASLVASAVATARLVLSFERYIFSDATSPHITVATLSQSNRHAEGVEKKPSTLSPRMLPRLALIDI